MSARYASAPLTPFQLCCMDEIASTLREMGPKGLNERFKELRKVLGDRNLINSGPKLVLDHLFLDRDRIPTFEKCLFSILCQICPLKTITNWSLWKSVHSASTIGEICEKCASRWDGLDGAGVKIRTSLRTELVELWHKSDIVPREVDKELQLTPLATGLMAILAKECHLEYAKEILQKEPGSLHADFVFARNVPSELWKVRIEQSCMEVELKRLPVAHFGADWQSEKPWTAHGNSGPAGDVLQFMSRAYEFFEFEDNRNLAYCGVLTDLEYFFFLKTDRSGHLFISEPMKLDLFGKDASVDGLLPIRVFISLLRRQQVQMKAAAGIRHFDVHPDFEPFEQPHFWSFVTESGNTQYVKALGTLGASEKSLVVACTSADDDTDWSQIFAEKSHVLDRAQSNECCDPSSSSSPPNSFPSNKLLSLKMVSEEDESAVKALKVEEFHLNILKHCPCVPHLISKGSVIGEAAPFGTVGLLLDTVGRPLDHLDASRLSVSDLEAVWVAMKVSVSQVHTFGIVHGDLKPSHFLVTRSGIVIIDFNGAINNWSMWKFSDGGAFNVRYTPVFASASVLHHSVPTEADDFISSAYSLISLMMRSESTLFKLPQDHQSDPSSLLDLVRGDCVTLAQDVLAQTGLMEATSSCSKGPFKCENSD